jgi:hypothetical protein
MRARLSGIRAALALALAASLGLAAPAAAQMQIEMIETIEEPDPSASQPRDGSVPCSEINNRAMEASLVIRQHASALSAGFEPEARAQAMVLLAWLDQWTGRLRGLVDLGEFTQCLDEGDSETYRRALATAARVGNQARSDLLQAATRPQAQPAQQQRGRRF